MYILRKHIRNQESFLSPTLMHLLEIKAAELENVQSDPERAQSAKLLENKSQH